MRKFENVLAIIVVWLIAFSAVVAVSAACIAVIAFISWRGITPPVFELALRVDLVLATLITAFLHAKP